MTVELKPLCYNCGRTESETRLLQRSKEYFEYWCHPCIVYKIRELECFDFVPDWLYYMSRRFSSMNHFKLGWRKRLMVWVSVQESIERKHKKFGLHYKKYDFAKWQVWRFRLLYEPERGLRQVNLSGISTICLGSKIKAVRPF